MTDLCKALLFSPILLLMLPGGYRAARSGVTIPLSDPLPYRPRAANHERAERLVALTIWGEARGRGDAGMRAIANVIVNRSRADDARFGHGAAAVVWRHRQFSCWNRSNPNRAAMRRIASLRHDGVDYRRWIAAKGIAHLALSGRLRDRTGGATYFRAGKAGPGRRSGMRLTRVAWGHAFFRPTSQPA